MQETSKQQLKLIAVNILDGCAPSIKKNLTVNSPYLFYNDYILSDSDRDGRRLITRNSEERHIDRTFFSYNSGENPIISISAIVGKNGSGKSAIIDVILRLINNISYKILCDYQTYVGAELRWIKGINAQLYFAVENDLYLLEQKGNEQKDCSLFKFDKAWKKQKSIKKTFSDNFFYTILMNYSLHAFNTWDYEEEWEIPNNESTCWINGISHKNDGYQTPVVINPMRTQGSINIRRENSLAKDRLISLFFNDKNEENTNFIHINEKNVVRSLIINLVPEKVQEKYQGVINNWNEHDVYLKDESFFEKLKSTIINYWKELYKFKPQSENDKEYDAATLYLVYKTIAIAQKYNAFDNFSCLSPSSVSSWDDRSNELKRLIAEIKAEGSHITFKLRQTLAFLIFRHIKTNGNKIEISIEDFAKLTDGKISKEWKYLDFVPAPCFNVEIQLTKQDKKEVYPFSKLSSGERQLIYTTSSVLYHIRNINSVKPNMRRVKYRHINIILDEIELYFHPEYQRKFVDTILNHINSVGYQDIESINMLMITHSPFILSDIPKNNVLFLDNGKSCRDMQEDTFGANIHTLLQNGFFMDSVPIGDFAKYKINKMFEQLHKADISEDLYNEILLVSEPFIRSQLLKKYKELSPAQKEYTRLEEEIKQLRMEIENIKKS